MRRALLAGVAVVLVAAGMAAPRTAGAVAAPTEREYAGTVTQEAYVTTRYGDTIDIDLCFPADKVGDTKPAPGRFPVVVELSYTDSAGTIGCGGGGTADKTSVNSALQSVPKPLFAELTKHGYVTGYVNVAGSGESEGGPWRFGEDTWALRSYDAIEWLGHQPWSTGNVGTMGCSGNGVSQVQTAPFRPPSLKTMILMCTSGDSYLMLYPGGMRSLSTSTLLCTIPGAGTYARNGLYAPPRDQQDVQRSVEIRREQVKQTQLPDCAATDGAWQHPVRDEWWDQNDADLGKVTIPTWVWGSWDDIFVRGSVDDYQSLAGRNNMIQMGYTSHAGNPPGWDYVAEAHLWFDRWLKGVRNSIDDDLRHRRFRFLTYGSWQPGEAKDFPVPGTRYTPYYLEAGDPGTPLANGVLSTAPPTMIGSTSYRYTPLNGVTAGGAYSGFARMHNESDPVNRDILAYNDPGGRHDQRLETPDRVVYLGQPVTQDTEITGPVDMTLYASTDEPDTDFVVKLLDVVPDDEVTPDGPQPGYWHLVTPGHLKGQFRSYKTDYRVVQPIEPGKVTKFDVQLWPVSWMVKKGHRIGVAIASADTPHVFPNDKPANVTVHSGPEYPSHVTLPVIPCPAPVPAKRAPASLSSRAVPPAPVPARVAADVSLTSSHRRPSSMAPVGAAALALLLLAAAPLGVRARAWRGRGRAART